MFYDRRAYPNAMLRIRAIKNNLSPKFRSVNVISCDW